MQFVRVESIAEGVLPLLTRLTDELSANDRVLWFVSGGSNVQITVSVMDRLPDELTSRLSIYLADERFGPVGHPDSNIQQLVNAGLDPKQATIVPVLVPAVALQETVERYNQIIDEAFKTAEVVIGQLGIGGDGHIAGILPDTSAVDSPDLVAGYSTETYTRITLTPHALMHFDVTYAFAFGDSKLNALTNLRDKALSIAEQPSQILKELPDSYVYTDQIDTVTEPKEES